MQYIILDFEWNQPWPGSYASKSISPVPIRGEIIQIGAVRMLDDQTIADEFQVLIRPQYFRKLNKRVSELTGIKESKLKSEGILFQEAIERFKQWCSEDSIFMTWGFDDSTILRENLCLYGYDYEWTNHWYNAQLIYNAQTDGSSSQKSLLTAMSICGIEPSRKAHDALGDAFHTAQVCATLDLKEGIRNYEHALKIHENGFQGPQPEGCLKRSVFHGYPDKDHAMLDMGGPENRCPTCGKIMKSEQWCSQHGHRFMTIATCPEHGKFLVRIRLIQEESGTLRVSRLIYDGTSEAAKSYENCFHSSKSQRHYVPRKVSNFTTK